MNEGDKISYHILMFAMPILLALLAFIGALAVNALVKMGNDLNAIKVAVQKITSEHEGLEKRVVHIENKLESNDLI